MSLIDIETEELIINPYIGIQSLDKKGVRIGEVSINVSSFGILCQRELIPLLDMDSFQHRELTYQNQRVYRVWSVTGEYNFPNKHTVSMTLPERGRIRLGFLEEEIIRLNLPKTYEYFKSR